MISLISLNTLQARGGSSKVFLGGCWVSSRVFLYNSLGGGGGEHDLSSEGASSLGGPGVWPPGVWLPGKF
jgi:hypothetical protein